MLLIFTSTTVPTFDDSFFHGLSSVSLYESEILLASISIETILTFTCCDADKTFEG